MSRAKNVAQEFAFRHIDEPVVVYNSHSTASHTTATCFACACGKKNARVLVECSLRHRYHAPLSVERVPVCTLCLERTFRVDRETLSAARSQHARARNEAQYNRAFEIVAAYPGLVVHPAVSTLLNLHASGQTLPPDVVSRAMLVLLVFANDEELRDNYLWLYKNRAQTGCRDVIADGLLHKHAGSPNLLTAHQQPVWPTREERQRVTALRLAAA